MAGRSHWSLAVEVVDCKIWFDVACRVQHRDGNLRSTYEWYPKVAEGGKIQLVSEGARVVEGENQLVILPREMREASPATIRWRYGFALS